MLLPSSLIWRVKFFLPFAWALELCYSALVLKGIQKKDWESREELNMSGERDERFTWLRTSPAWPCHSYPVLGPTCANTMLSPAAKGLSLAWGRHHLPSLRCWRNGIRLKAKASLSWNTSCCFSILCGESQFCDCAAWGSVEHMLLKPLVLSPPGSRGLCTSQRTTPEFTTSITGLCWLMVQATPGQCLFFKEPKVIWQTSEQNFCVLPGTVLGACSFVQ